jgi:hypothetical protein
MFWLVLAFLFVFSGTELTAEGFLADTHVKTSSSGYAAIEALSVGDQLLCPDLRGIDHAQKIARIHKVTPKCEREDGSTRVVFVSIDGEIIGMAPDQRFYCPEHAQWVIAQDSAESGACAHLFDNIWVQDYDAPVTFYAITLDTSSTRDASCEIYPHFYVTNHDLIVHNAGPGIIMIPGIILGMAATSPVAAVGILGCAAWGIKKLVDEFRFRSKDCTKDSAGSRVEQNFDKNYRCPYHVGCHRPHPHGLHVGAGYHGKEQIGRKSPGPRDGQLALDFSIEVAPEGNSRRRVGLSCGQIVVFMYTMRDAFTGQNIWHGHVVEWEKAIKDVKDALEGAGWANDKGKMKWPHWSI